MRHGPEFYRRDFPTKKKLEHLKEEKEQFICPCIYEHTLTYAHAHAHTHAHTYVHAFRPLQIKSKLNQSKAVQITPKFGFTGNLNSAETSEQLIQTLF